MNKLLLTLFLGINYRNKLILSYEKLKTQRNTEKIVEIKSLIEKEKIKINEPLKHDEEYKRYGIDINLSFTQYVYQKLINLYFNCFLIHSLADQKTFHYPLPYEWRQILIKNNIKVSHLSSFLYKMISVLIFIIYFVNLIKNLFSYSNKNLNSKKVYLNSIGENVLLSKNKGFIFWLKKLLHQEEFQIYHNLKFKFKKKNNINEIFCYNYFYCLMDTKLKLKYILSFFLNYIASIFFEDSNKNFFFIETFSLKFLLDNKVELPDFAMFNNSSFVYRPLWTYVLEKNKKKSVLFYFYSVNCFARKKYMHGYSLMNWPNYLVWVDEQKVWIKNLLDYDYNLIEGTYPPLEGEDIKKISKSRKTVTVFDVIPSSKLFYSIIGNPYNQYTYKFCSQFLIDVMEILNQFDIDIILKTKRLFFKNTFVFSKEYMDLIIKMQTKYKFQLCDQSFSAENLINSSDAVISIPYTSPAYLGTMLKKPSIFYSNLEAIDSELIADRNILKINSKENLKFWLQNNLNEK